MTNENIFRNSIAQRKDKTAILNHMKERHLLELVELKCKNKWITLIQKASVKAKPLGILQLTQSLYNRLKLTSLLYLSNKCTNFTGYMVCSSIILICSPWGHYIKKEVTKAIYTCEPTSKHLQLNNRFMVRNNLTLVPDISLLLQISLKPSTV